MMAKVFVNINTNIFVGDRDELLRHSVEVVVVSGFYLLCLSVSFACLLVVQKEECSCMNVVFVVRHNAKSIGVRSARVEFDRLCSLMCKIYSWLIRIEKRTKHSSVTIVARYIPNIIQRIH
jgi:hypothetical protein